MIEMINATRDDRSEVRDRNRANINKRRRAQLRRQKHIFFGMTFALIIVAGIAFGSVHSYATQKNNVARTKCFKSILVESGDTLASIADENMCVEFKSSDALISEIKGINHISDDISHLFLKIHL